jgi:hypothetical protein
MSATHVAPFTAVEYREMPDDGRRYQLVEGEFFTAPAPSTFHQIVQTNLVYILRGFLLTPPSAPCSARPAMCTSTS